MATGQTYQKEDAEITVRELVLAIRSRLHYLLSQWKIILVAGIVGGLLGLCFAIIKSPQYSATTTFVLETGDSRGGLAQYAGLAAMVGIDLGGRSNGLFQGDNILELYKSRKMIVQTLLSKTSIDSKELLIDRYIAFKDLKAAWQDDPDLSSLDFSIDPSKINKNMLRKRDSVLSTFVSDIRKKMLTVDKPDKNLSIIEVNVTSPDEFFSYAFNDNLVRIVNDFYVQTKTKKTTGTIELLQTKVDSVRQVMESAIYLAVKTTDATPNINPTRQVQRLAPSQQAQFSAEANKTMLSQLIQHLELARMNLAQEQPLIQIIDQPVYPLPVERVGKLKGIVLGAFIFGFLTLSFLVIRKWYQNVIR